MGFKSETTRFKCQITIKIAPFLPSVIFVGIRVVISKSQIFQRVWYRQLYTEWDRPHCRWKIWIFHCVWIWRWSLLCLLNKSNNLMSFLSASSKPYEQRTAFGMNHSPIMWEAPHIMQQIWGTKILSWSPTLHSKRFLMSRVKFCLLRFAGHFTTHTNNRRCQDDLNTPLAWWKFNKHNHLHKTLQ